MKFATAYTLPKDRSRPATINTEDTMTQQADANDTDINVIMARYNQTGQLPEVLTEPMFGDFTGTLDYATAVSAIRVAEEAFLEVPAKIREQFGNDPGAFIKFASDPQNKDRLKEMGLLKETPPPTIAEQTLNAIKELKQEKDDGKNTNTAGHRGQPGGPSDPGSPGFPKGGRDS